MKRQFKQWWSSIQQNNQSPLILTELTEHKKDHDMMLENLNKPNPE